VEKQAGKGNDFSHIK